MLIFNHNKGRLGNSLFRLFANIVFIVANNDNNSQIINESPRTRSDLVVTDNYFINWMNKLLYQNQVNKINMTSILFDGYYQHDSIFIKFKQHIVDYIKNHPELILKTDKNENYNAINFIDYKITKKYKIVVHLRLEDFIDIGHVINPSSIKNVIDKINKEYNNEPICFVLNKPKTELEQKYIHFFTSNYHNIIIESNDVLTDYTIMKEATILVCSCSTLSWAAAILSNTLQKVYMPNYKNVNGSHQTCKQPISNTELYEIDMCSKNELLKILI